MSALLPTLLPASLPSFIPFSIAQWQAAQRSILLVDDEPLILSALSRTLRREGYAIYTCSNPCDVPALLKEHPIGLIISDQRMPQMSGTELLAQIKSDYPWTVRMVLSGYTDLDSVTQAINLGAIYKFLTKPWDDEALKREIRAAFARLDEQLATEYRMQQLSDERSILLDLTYALEQSVIQKSLQLSHRAAIDQTSIDHASLDHAAQAHVGILGINDDWMITAANHVANQWLVRVLFPDHSEVNHHAASLSILGQSADGLFPMSFVMQHHQPLLIPIVLPNGMMIHTHIQRIGTQDMAWICTLLTTR
jgi:CheY-like chemotaxis protein